MTHHCSVCKKQKPASEFYYYYKSGPREGKPHQRCKPCHTAYYKQQRDERRAAGLCTSCGEDAGGQSLCASCKQKRKRSRAARAGLPCNACGIASRTPDGHYCKPCRSAKQRERRQKIKDEVFAHYGANCDCCNESTSAFLAIDHIEGNGRQHRQSVVSGGGSNAFYRWLITEGFPEGFRVLCHNCNVGRFVNGGTCPHESLSA